MKKRIAEINRENREKEEQKEIKTLENNYLPKLEEYEKHLETLSNRNSYSKTDPDATFMHLKDDHMQNGQLKPAYNLQIGTANQFISHFDFFPNPTDFLTFKPFVNSFKERFQENFAKVLNKAVADSGYGSEENYDFMQCMCYKAKGNRRIEVNHNLNRHKERVRQLLTSEEGLYHRSMRPIEPEAVFGQGKSNKQYFRFRHFGKELITMDFAIFAIAFNLGKMYNKNKIKPQNTKSAGKDSKKSLVMAIFTILVVVFAHKQNINHSSASNLKLVA